MAVPPFADGGVQLTVVVSGLPTDPAVTAPSTGAAGTVTGRIEFDVADSGDAGVVGLTKAVMARTRKLYEVPLVRPPMSVVVPVPSTVSVRTSVPPVRT